MRNVDDIYPLSPMQKGLLFLRLYSRHPGAYVEQVGWSLEGKFDEASFVKAWQEVIERHPVMRTAFFWDELKEPMQVVRQTVDLPWQRHDWRKLNSDARPGALRDFLELDRQRDFDLSRAPLLRLAQMRLSEDSYQFIWTYHHLILDGWSISLVLTEVFQRYKALCSGTSATIEGSRPFRDYIEWLTQQSAQSAESYWREKLKGFTEPTALGIESSEAVPEESVGYATKTALLSVSSSEGLRRFARRNQLTLSAMVEGAWALLLSRYSASSDVIFGVVVNGRPPALAGSESMVGLFINTLPVRVRIEPYTRCVSWLMQLHLQQVAMRRHEHTSLAQIQEWSEVSRGENLFKSIVAFDSAPAEQATDSEQPARIGDVFRANSVTNYPITLGVVAGPALSLQLTYDASRFDRLSITRMLKHLENLMLGLGDDHNQRLCDLAMLSEGERQQLVTEWNDTSVELEEERTVTQLIEARAARSPDKTAIVFGEARLTYAELISRANTLAYALGKLGVGPETLVGIYAERSLEMVWSLLGVMKSGAAYVPLDPTFPDDRIAFMIADSRIKVLLTQKRFAAHLPAHDAKVLVVDDDLFFTTSAGQPSSGAVLTENLAYVIYTSGSTGRPKGVQIEHRALTNFLQSVHRQPGLTSDDVFLSVTTFSFDISALEFYLPLIAGACLVIASRETAWDGLRLKQLLADSAATVMQATPATWRLLVDAGWEGDHRLKILCGGEALSRKLANQLLERCNSLWNMYGPTETTIWSSMHRIEARGAVSIGLPISNTSMFILDGDLEPAPVNVPGELYIGGEGLARGYLRRAALTADNFIPNPFGVQAGQRLYRTGDIARRLPDGTIECIGRTDDQVKVRGSRIELGEIESVLNRHPSVQQSMVTVREDQPGDRRLVAYIISPKEIELNPAALRAHLKAHLPEYMLPAAFVAIDEIPLTPNGKIDRRALPPPGSARPEIEAKFAAPRNPAEKVLAAIWTEVLGIDEVGIHDNFFELGGDSIMSLQIMSKARRAGLDIVPKDVFEQQTIALLAMAASPPTESDDEPERMPLPRIQSPELKSFTPSDFPLCSVTQQNIDELTRDGLPVQDIYSLSPMQEGMLFHSLRSPQSNVYCEQMSFSIEGELDVDSFYRAWLESIERHSILRTAFVWKNLDEPVQIVHECGSLHLEKEDWRGLAPDAQSERLFNLQQADRKRGFNFSAPPLMRLTLIRTGDRRFEVVWTYHHILLDGWSVTVLFSEVLKRYETLRQDIRLPLAPEHSYRHYIAWLKQRDIKQAEAFWRARLEGFSTPTPLLMSVAETLIADASDAYDQQEITLSRDQSDRLRALTREHHLTLSSVAQGCWALLLSGYSGEDDVVFGVTVSGRPPMLPEAEAMIGLFINTLPVRVQLSKDDQILTWLKRLQANQAEALDFSYSQLSQVQGWSDVPRGVPLFESLMVFENYPLNKASEVGSTSLKIESARTIERTDYPLTVVIVPGEELTVRLLYDCRRFEHTAMTRLLFQLRNLFESMTAGIAQTISELLLTFEAEDHAALVEWNDTQAPYPASCFHQLFEKQANRTPNALAVSCPGQALSYRQLNERANQLAHFLRKLGVGPEIRVAVCVARSSEMVIARLGVLKAGGAYLSLDPEHPPALLDFMVDDAGARVLITEERFIDRFDKVRAKVLCLERARELISQENKDNPTTPVSADNLAYVYYTSGSTGKPKGVAIEHKGLVNLVTWHNHAYEVTPDDRKSQISGLGFDASVWELWPYLVVGASVHVPDDQTRAAWPELLKWMIAERITISFLPTPLAEAVMDDEWPAELSLRALLTGGDKLHRWPQHRLPFLFVNKYGPTEVSAVTTWAPLTPASARYSSPPIGRPIANTRCYVLDDNLRSVPVGAAGQLYIGGVGLARGYLNRPDLTAEKFIPDPFSKVPAARLYNSGDLVRRLADGNIDFLGRQDHQVKIRGYRIELGEIEKCLAEHPAVREAVVLVNEGLSAAKQLSAYFVPNESAATVSELRDFLRERLPASMVPSSFISLKALPLTRNGKIDRRALAVLSKAESAPSRAYEAPRSPVEVALAEIWAQVLELERVGIDDNFFELGGDSILTIRIISRAEQRGIELSPNQLFLYPTIRELVTQCPITIRARSTDRHETGKVRSIEKRDPASATGQLTPADFPNADLEQHELDDLLARFAVTERVD
jgi:amino acid adenylation domain-containing protein